MKLEELVNLFIIIILLNCRIGFANEILTAKEIMTNQQMFFMFQVKKV